MKKKLVTLLITVMCVMMLGGCKASNSPEVKEPETTDQTSDEVSDEANVEDENTSQNESDSYYPVTITTYNYNHEKVEVTFDSMPEKVICGYQNNIETMMALGLEDKIVYAFGMDDEIAEEYAEAFSKVPYSNEAPSKEDVIAMQPDLILGWYSLFADDRLGDVDFWIDRNCNTYMSLNSSALGSSEEFPRITEYEYEDIMNIGIIFNCVDKAQALVDQMKAEEAKAAEYAKTIAEPLSVAILEDESGSYRVYGANTLGGDIATKAGAILAVGSENSNNISAEDLIAADPDVIFMVYYTGYINEEEAVASIMNNKAFASLSAVKNKRVYALNLTSIYCSGIRTYEGITNISSALYPELQ